jgi:hypothetical protein
MTEDMASVGETLFCIAKRHNKGYCYASQATIQRLMTEYRDWNRSERTVRRRLKDLGDQGYLKITHRNWSEVNGVKKFRTNLYIFSKKWFEWVGRAARFARKVFSFFRRPKLANYSLPSVKRDLQTASGNVEILLKSAIKGKPSPVSLHG